MTGLRRFRMSRWSGGGSDTGYGRTVTALCRECRAPLFEVIVDGAIDPRATPMEVACARCGAFHLARLDRAILALRATLDRNDALVDDETPAA